MLGTLPASDVFGRGTDDAQLCLFKDGGYAAGHCSFSCFVGDRWQRARTSDDRGKRQLADDGVGYGDEVAGAELSAKTVAVGYSNRSQRGSSLCVV